MCVHCVCVVLLRYWACVYSVCVLCEVLDVYTSVYIVCVCVCVCVLC